MGQIEVRNIDDYCRCVFTGRGTVCTFVDCMENTFAVGPDGGIYPCYRFVGMPQYVMGNVHDRPSLEDLSQSDTGKLMHRFKDYVDQECRGCKHVKYCRGGCPYNAIVPTEGDIEGVDPHCTAYKRIFNEITDRFNRELSSGFLDMEMTGTQSEPTKNVKPGIMSLMRKIVSS